jgi:ribosomal protein L37AE/L43A
MSAETNKTSPITLQGVCPSCGKTTTFDLLGVQRWPERVAKKSGLPMEQTMWQCRNCATTLMQASLEPVTNIQAS